VIFGLIYLWWFLLTPGSRYTFYANSRHYGYGLILLGLFGASSIFFIRLKKSHGWSVLLRLTAILFFVILSGYTALNMPRIDDAVFNKSTLYFVAHFVDGDCRCIFRPVYEFTKWDWFFKYDTAEIYVSDLFGGGSIVARPWFGARVYLRYDKKLQQMNVIDVTAKGDEYLVYTYSVPPRYWIPETIDGHFDENLNFIPEDAARLEEKRYYMSSECKVDSGHTNCESWTYMLYQCAADNTSCIPFPFQYEQERQFGGFYVEGGNAVSDLNVYVSDLLIYTYGAHPRCHVAECKILKPAK
jgi:hypothetical protein